MSEFMKEALCLAESAARAGEIPVGAVIVRDGRVTGRGENRQVRDCDPSAHAEVSALREAGRNENNYRLDGAVMYVTVKPCAMCREAIRRARIEKVFYAAPPAKEATHITEYTGLRGYAGSAEELMKDFFQEKRL